MERLFNGVSRQMQFAQGVADYIGNGAVEVPIFEPQILDNTRKRGTLLQRVQTKMATGHPTRYFEKVAHDSKAKFVNPRAIDHLLDTQVTVEERSAYIKAMVDGITFTQFDLEVYSQQGSRFGNLEAQHLNEVITDMLDSQDRAVWEGKATSLMDSTSPEYCSLTTQIKKKGTVTGRLATGIIDNVAQLMNNKQYSVHPTAIYLNPLDKATLDAQELDAKDKIKTYDVEVTAGLTTNGIMTAAGILPLITDVYCPKGTIAILDEKQIERQYVTSPVPRVYQLGTVKDLATRFVAIMFDTFIVKAADYGHMVVTVGGGGGKP